ncbi:MAG: MmcQ/YjbR family DNA-binding protein [Flavobacteriales bacterium]|nr:MmcQ/YjbR family DNA-binding protein [Flavobacteriales bacterium]
MNIEELRNYCLSLKGVEETLPFGPETLVYKVMGKVFALVSMDEFPLRCNVKCQPDHVDQLRENYTGVIPGYHMNKQHWNTLVFDGSFTEDDAKRWVLDSYDLIVDGLPKRIRTELRSLT